MAIVMIAATVIIYLAAEMMIVQVAEVIMKQASRITMLTTGEWNAEMYLTGTMATIIISRVIMTEQQDDLLSKEIMK